MRIETIITDAETRRTPPKKAIGPLILGNSPAVQQLRRLIEMVAPSLGAVMVLGPTGAGKDLVAQEIHRLSNRQGRFVAINCAAIPTELLESELFGYERGAFTGADRARQGRFEEASGGTLFLDEIGDMPLALQSKLLRTLETHTISRVGGSKEIALDLRLICATHQNIEQMVEDGRFRADLYYRLAVFPIHVPPLSERKSDIPLLVEAMVAAYCARAGSGLPPNFSSAALETLKDYAWPGNVRELRNLVERAFILFSGTDVTAQNVRENLLRMRVPSSDEETNILWAETEGLTRDVQDAGNNAGFAPPSPEAFRNWFDYYDEINLRRFLRDVEVVLIEAALEAKDGCVSHAADAVKLRRTTLIEKMKKLMIERPQGLFED